MCAHRCGGGAKPPPHFFTIQYILGCNSQAKHSPEACVTPQDERARKYAVEVQSLQFNVLVTTYEYIMRDRSRLSKASAHSYMKQHNSDLVEETLYTGSLLGVPYGSDAPMLAH